MQMPGTSYSVFIYKRILKAQVNSDSSLQYTSSLQELTSQLHPETMVIFFNYVVIFAFYAVSPVAS